MTGVAAVLVALLLFLPRTATAATVGGSTSSTARLLASTTEETTSGGVATAQVGTLFAKGSSTHGCTASVIHSTSGDLVLTAAHCVSGTGAGMTFAPGYANGVAPYGTWTVVAAHAPSGWLTGQDEDDDMAVLTLAPQVVDGVSRTVESVVGAETIGSTPASGTTVTALGYVTGTGGSGVTCTTRTATTTSDAVPTLACAGFAGGTSGGPWLTTTSDGGTSVVAMVSGRNQGGCTDDVSYSAPFDETLTQLVAAAQSQPGQSLPVAGGSGC